MPAAPPRKGQMVLVGNAAGERAAIVTHVYDSGSVNCSTFTREGLVVPRQGVPPEADRSEVQQECWKVLDA